MRGRASFADIVSALNADPEAVVQRYCSVDGAWRDLDGRYWCLNPMRPDRRVGSFCINLRPGAHQGKWVDYATGEHGDMLDLIERVDGCSRFDALQTAKQLLGLVEMTPARRRELERQRLRREAERQAELARAAEVRKRREGWAQRLWLSAEPIAGSPAAVYLAGRGIHLERFPRMPNALRFHPACLHRHVDRDTGEVIDQRLPAMLAAIAGRDGRIIGCHRTYLAPRGPGRVVKAGPQEGVPNAKMVLGSKDYGAIRLWSGLGPRGGPGAPLAQAPAGSRVYIAEGIEDGLSIVAIEPDWRVLVSVTLENMVKIALPESVSEVVLVADNDAAPEAQAQLDKAIQAHADAGRTVRLWQAPPPHKDLNDWLQAATHVA